MIRRLAILAALALMLGACATYNSGYAERGGRDGYYNSDAYSSGDGYYAAGHDGYGDYYYDNPQVVIDEHYGSYGGGYSDYGYSPFGFGYGWGYPYNGFGLQFGFGPGWYGGYPYGYYAPWYGWGDYRHHHRRDNDGDNDADDRRIGGTGLLAPTPGMREQRSIRNRQSNPLMPRAGGGPGTGERPPSRSPDAERAELRQEQGRFSDAPAPREQRSRRRPDADGDGR